MCKEIKFNRTTLISVFLATVLVGLFIGKFTVPISIWWLIFVVLLLPFSVRKGLLALVVIIACGLLMGWWRGGILQAQNTAYYDIFNKTVILTAQATEDGFYSSKSQLEFTADKITIDNQTLPGKIRVWGFGEAAVYRHDIVKVHGKLYPALGGKQANISFAELDVIKRAQSPIDNFRRDFITGVESALPEPAASLGVGLLVGQRSLLPVDIALILTAAGLTHIVAVSGYNLTIIIRGTTKSLKRLSRFQILACSLFLIYTFLLVTGYAPSIVRAAIVATLGLIAWYFGRNIKPILLILIAAAITAFYNPYYVWGDIGWYLSFLAFFGILIVGPALTIRLFKHKKAPLLACVAIESLSAQIMTLPLIMLIFSRVSIISFLSNIVVVPLVPFGMLFTMFAGFAGMLVPAISGWIALPARIVLNTIISLAKWFSGLPGAKVQVSASAIAMLILYGILLILILGLNRRAQSVTIEQKQMINNKD